MGRKPATGGARDMLNPLKSILSDLGLDEKEASIYLAVLELGKGTVHDIANKSGMIRTTLYPILEDMLQRKLIFKAHDSGPQRFYAQDPIKILAEKKASVEKLEHSMPIFTALQKRTGSAPMVKLFEGENAHVHFFNDTLLMPMNSELLTFSATLNIEKYLPADYFEEYSRQRIARNILIRVIASNSPTARRLVRSAAQELRSIRVVPSFFNFTADMIIYGSKVATLSWEDNFSCMVIDNDKVAQMLKTSFELMWEGAKRYEQDLPYYIYPNEIIL